MHKYDSKETIGPPPILHSGEKQFKTFSAIAEWWVSRGVWGNVDVIEKQFGESADSVGNNYESLDDHSVGSFSLDSLKHPAPVASSVSGSASIPRVKSKLADIDLNQDWNIVEQTLILGGVYYTYCVILFAKFWLDKGLISVDSDTARERLNNAYLDKEFVGKLSIDPNSALPDLLKKIHKLSDKLNAAWKASGWTKQELGVNGSFT
jgi:hypothetical protein